MGFESSNAVIVDLAEGTASGDGNDTLAAIENVRHASTTS
jgi:hypothetical protein